MTRSAGSGVRRSARVRCAIYTRKSSEEKLQQECPADRPRIRFGEPLISQIAAFWVEAIPAEL